MIKDEIFYRESIILNLYVKAEYSKQVIAKEKKIRSKYQLLSFKVFTLKFALYSKYYSDLQEKGLKMKAKKKIMRLMIGTR